MWVGEGLGKGWGRAWLSILQKSRLKNPLTQHFSLQSNLKHGWFTRTTPATPGSYDFSVKQG